jgi:hypothetical protein
MRAENCDVRIERIEATADKPACTLFRISSSNGNRIAGYGFRSHIAMVFDLLVKQSGMTIVWCFNDVFDGLAEQQADPIDAPKFRRDAITIQRRRGEADIANHAVFAELGGTESQLSDLKRAAQAQLRQQLEEIEGTWDLDVRDEVDSPSQFRANFRSLQSRASALLGNPADPAPQPDPDDIYDGACPRDILAQCVNLIIEGVPGTGKSYAVLDLTNLVYGDRVTTVVMHPATGYEDLIEGVRPANGAFGSERNLNPIENARFFHQCYGHAFAAPATNQQGPFVVRAGHFLVACAKACASPAEKFLLVLDEINRCNVPRAFGELLLLIEPSKRWTWNGTDWTGEHGAVLPYSGLRFFVPDNLHVLGTMNTTDRSVAPLDQALRRRFAFHRLEPMKPDLLKNALGDAAIEPAMAEAIAAWDALNGELENKLGPDMMLGHSYFFDAARAMAGGTAAISAVRNMWRLAILPQLIDILHTANRADLARHAELASHLRAVGLKLEPKGEGLHALLRVCASDAEAKA